MIDKTSIVVVAWDTNQLQRMITSACLGNIVKFTNRDEYELIFVDQCQTSHGITSLDERHNKIIIDKDIQVPENIGYSAACNLGYKKSNPDYKYICFVHSDVFVPDNWLSELVRVSDGKHIVMPNQGITTREAVVESYTKEDLRAWDDAGVILMPKEDFVKSGGWDERFKAIYMDAIFRYRFGSRYYCTNKVIITHIGGISYYLDRDYEDKLKTIEAPLYNQTRDEITNEIPQPNYL